MEEKSIIHCICEGAVTEPNYFQELISSKSDLPFRFEFIEKDEMDYNRTSREDLISMAEAYYAYHIEGQYTVFKYVTMLMNILWQDAKTFRKNPHEPYKSYLESIYKPFDISNDYLEAISNDFARIRRRLVKELSTKEEWISDGKCIKTENGIPDKIDNYVNSDKEVQNLLKNLRKNQSTQPLKHIFNKIDRKHFNDNDHIFVIIDRDFDSGYEKKQQKQTYNLNEGYLLESRSDSIYKQYIKRCNDLNFNLLLSNPFFEIWLMMHNKTIRNDEYFTDAKDVSKVDQFNKDFD